jgi:hypothetical protein
LYLLNLLYKGTEVAEGIIVTHEARGIGSTTGTAPASRTLCSVLTKVMAVLSPRHAMPIRGRISPFVALLSLLDVHDAIMPNNIRQAANEKQTFWRIVVVFILCVLF